MVALTTSTLNESFVEPSPYAWLRSRAPVPTTYAPTCEPLYPFQEILENRTSRARGTTGSCTAVSARKFAICIEIWQVELESCVWRVSFHKYAYVHGDPVNGIDPTGEFLSVLGSVFISMNVRAEHAKTNMRAYLDVQALFSDSLKFFLDMYDLVGLGVFFGSGATILAMKSSGMFSRTFARLATMASHSPALAARLTDFVERVVPILGKADFGELPGNVQKLITRVHKRRIESRVLDGSGNFAGALVQVRDDSGRWRSLSSPRVAQSEKNLLHSEEVLVNDLNQEFGKGNYRITHLFSERIPCVPSPNTQGSTGCTELLANLEKSQGTQIKTFSLPIESGSDPAHVMSMWWKIFE
jgi:hypothetical protein